jgi:hypothetical protein
MNTLVIEKENIDIIKNAINLEKNIYKTKSDYYKDKLKKFEKKYNMDSKTFYKKFNLGELEDDSDFFEWEYYCELDNKIKDDLIKINNLDI